MFISGTCIHIIPDSEGSHSVHRSTTHLQYPRSGEREGGGGGGGGREGEVLRLFIHVAIQPTHCSMGTKFQEWCKDYSYSIT